MRCKLYLATSWKNELYDEAVRKLEDNGYEVYKFRDTGFKFKGEDGTLEKNIEDINTPEAISAFRRDINALQDCDVCVLLNPCGISSHIEAGYINGLGKQVFAVGFPKRELLYKLFCIIENIDVLIVTLKQSGY